MSYVDFAFDGLSRPTHSLQAESNLEVEAQHVLLLEGDFGAYLGMRPDVEQLLILLQLKVTQRSGGTLRSTTGYAARSILSRNDVLLTGGESPKGNSCPAIFVDATLLACSLPVDAKFSRCSPL